MTSQHSFLFNRIFEDKSVDCNQRNHSIWKEYKLHEVWVGKRKKKKLSYLGKYGFIKLDQ